MNNVGSLWMAFTGKFCSGPEPSRVAGQGQLNAAAPERLSESTARAAPWMSDFRVDRRPCEPGQLCTVGLQALRQIIQIMLQQVSGSLSCRRSAVAGH